MQKCVYFHFCYGNKEIENNIKEFVDFTIKDKYLGNIGRIIQTENFKGNIVFTILQKEKEILYPYIKQNISSIDMNNKIIYVKTSPDGIFDI